MKNVLLPVIIEALRAMEVIKEVEQAREIIARLKADDNSIGLVPTMGALHEGHLSLVKASLKANETTLVTIFVNPIQFNNPDDFAKYPVSIEADLELLDELGVDYVFMPSKEEMYAREPLVKLSFGHLDEVLEGKHRPGHFSGVAIVVAKIFNILTPTRAYFGQKDLQQFKVIEQLVNDLSMPVELVMMPIVREQSGLAMSSRNRRLSTAGLEVAGKIYKALLSGVKQLEVGESIATAIKAANEILTDSPEITTEYLEVVDFEDLQYSESNTSTNRLVLCFAGYIEGIRLIDNVIVGKE